MSKNVPPKQPQKSAQKEEQTFPTCINKKEARLVCLNPDCDQHAFFCTSCENDECEVIHHHGNKLLSVSFKQYIKKVLKEKRVDEDLEEALNAYTSCLQKLKKDVEQFVEKQLTELEEIRNKAADIGEEEEKIVQKLRKKQYSNLIGGDLDRLWQKMTEMEKKDKNKETVEFLEIKKQQIKQISDNFEKVNKMELDDYMEEDENKTDKQKTKEQQSQSKLSKNDKITKEPQSSKKEETTPANQKAKKK